MSRKTLKFRTDKFDSETNGNFDSSNSCKRLGTSRLYELLESKFSFVSRIEFIRSKLSKFSDHVCGVAEPDSERGRPLTGDGLVGGEEGDLQWQRAVCWGMTWWRGEYENRGVNQESADCRW